MTNHIKCTLEENKAWCGEELDSSFNFKDVESVVINARTNGTTAPCVKCLAVVVNYLEEVWKRVY